MTVAAAATAPARPQRFALDDLERFCREAMRAAGGNAATADATARALVHGSRIGIDSHGVRFLTHYVETLLSGRVNPRPELRMTRRFASVATLDADFGHGALATYTAINHAVDIAEEAGIGAVSVIRSSHFGSGGAYALAAAERGAIGLVMCNTDSFVRLHDGASRFHGTNPISCAIPNPGGRPWLLDMATSSIPRNRVVLYETLGRALPPGVASDGQGRDTTDPAKVEMLAPLGGDFGFKGAALAGLVEIMSAVITGMELSFELAPMFENLEKTRDMGAFTLAIRTDAFVPPEVFAAGMNRYVAALRASPARAGAEVLAPGDREWAEADARAIAGAPLAPETVKEFQSIAERYGLEAPVALDG